MKTKASYSFSFLPSPATRRRSPYSFHNGMIKSVVTFYFNACQLKLLSNFHAHTQFCANFNGIYGFFLHFYVNAFTHVLVCMRLCTTDG